MLLFLFITLPSSSNLFGQIVIKERVKIEPKENFSKKKFNQVQSNYWPCGPYPQGTESLYRQVVWQGSSYPLDVRQHAFDIQDNVEKTSVIFPMDVYEHTLKIISGSVNCTILEYFPWYGSMKNYIPPEEVFGLINLNLPEMVGDATERGPYWEPDIVDGECINCEHQYTFIQGVKTTLEFLKYRIIFNKPGTVVFEITSDTVKTKFETIIVEPDYDLKYISDNAITHLEEVEINVKADIIQCDFVSDWTEDFTSYYNGGSLSLENKFNVSIIEGSEFGTLTYVDDSDPYNTYKEEGTSFSNLIDTYGLKFLTNGEYPSDTSKVKLRFTTTGPSNVTPIDVEISIIENPNYPIKVNIVPNTLSAGDTATITLEKRTSEDWYDDPIYEPFNDEQEFNVSIVKGGELGSLYSGYEGSESDDFFYITQEELLFIAETNVTIDEILIKASTEIGDEQWDSLSSNKKGKRKKKGNSIQGIAPPTGGATIYGIGKIKGGEEILLGETKYFGLKSKDGEYEISEIVTEYGIEPIFPNDIGGWSWIKTADVWGSNPIEVLGTKASVYWEHKWFDKSDNKNKKLSDGMIRLIGRYWEEGKEDDFKVKLNTSNNAKIEVKVIKPGKLLKEGQLPSYSKARDVFDMEYSIDELCIKYGGLYGIPPQMLKGQMLKESAKKDFGGTVGVGFAPSYRYEPYTTQFTNGVKEILNAGTNPFIVTENAMGKTGSASVPTKSEHKHLEHNAFFHYFESSKTVWDIIEEKSRLVNINNTYTTYGFRYEGTGKDTLKKGQVKSGVYLIIDKTYQDYLKGKKDEDGNREGGYEKAIKDKYSLKDKTTLSRVQQTEANDSARVATIKFLKNDYKGKLDEIIAQTRIASSYGLLQSLYTTILDEHNYPDGNDDNPEKLNEVDISMEYSMKHLKKLFNHFNKLSLDENNANWESQYSGNDDNKGGPNFPKPDAGYEEALKVMFYMWNSGLTDDLINAIYHTYVLNYSEKFIPRRK